MIKIKREQYKQGQRCGCRQPSYKKKDMKEKCLNNNAKHENEQVKKKAWQIGQFDTCWQTKGWQTNLLKKSDD